MKAELKRILVGMLVSSMVLSNVMTSGAADMPGSTEPAAVQENKESAVVEEAEKEADVTVPEAQPEKTVPEPEAPAKDPEKAEPEASAEEPAKNEKALLTYEFTDMTVEASLETPDSLPAGVTLEVLPVWDQSKENEPDAVIQSYYDSFRTLFENQTAEHNIQMQEYLSYTIQFVKDGEVFEPAGNVSITYKYNEGLVLGNLMSDASNLDIYYLDDQSDANELKLGTIADDKKFVTMSEDGTRVKELAFETTNFEQFTIGTNDDVPVSYTYEDESMIAIVTADRLDNGIFGAELVVTPIEKGDAYKEAEQLLTEQAEGRGEELGGFLAYDISFIKDGKEVEPSNQVNVSLNFKESVKPEGVEAEKVALGHIKEEINGNKKLEELTGAAISKTEEAAVESTEFTVDSFSTFLISWEVKRKVGDKPEEKNEYYLDLFRIDQNGKEIGADVALTQDKEITLATLANGEAAVPGYEYVESKIASAPNQAEASTTKATKLRLTGDWGRERWQYRNGNKWTDIGKQKVYMIYKKGADIAQCDKLVVKEKSKVFDIYANQNASEKAMSDEKKVTFQCYLDNKEYSYVRYFNEAEMAFYVDANSKYSVEKIEIVSGKTKTEYQNNDPNKLFSLNQGTTVNIYLVAAAEKLTTIKTVDSASKGVKIEMFDYREATPESGWGGYGNGTIKQGLLKPTLSEKGLPIRNDTSKELTDSFQPSGKNYRGEANHLFSQSIYDGDGTYSYSSFENYAYYNQGSGNFTVYNQIGTPSENQNFFYQRGNFMPYNQIKEGEYSENTNLYDENGNKLDKSAPRYNEPLYKLDGTNYQFGQVITANFAQPKGGIQNGKEMIYEFNGDDDLWVFVDGVLVLDIGGIHDAHSGYINFATGEVGVRDCKTSEKPVIKATTIKEQFGVEAKDDKNWKGNTFSDYSSHQIKIFYMERGAGASNCKMKFNLPVVPEGSINVKKEITNINEGAFSDVLFDFKLYIEDEKGDTSYQEKDYQLKANQKYELLDVDGRTSLGMKETGADGTFQLKHGQTARFEKAAEMGTSYFIEETGVTQEQYDEFFINGTEISENGGEVGGEAGNGFIVRSNPLEIGEDATVVFGNHCAATNFQNLVIGKKLYEGQSSKDEYQVKVMIGGKPYTGDYYINKGGTAGDAFRTATKEGVITLTQDEFVTIKSIPSETSFEIQEMELDVSKYEEEAYKVEGADDSNMKGKATGTLRMKSNAKVTITNQQLLSKLTITKDIDELYDINGDAIFTFKITGPDDLVLYRTMRFSSENKGTVQTIVIENLPFGTYQVEELDTMRYVCQGDANRSVALQDVKGAEVEFVNDRKYDDNYSHTDVVVNKFRVDGQGNVTVVGKDDLRGEKE